MLKLFLVFIICFYSIYTYPNKYCEICPNHTFCMYEGLGPSSTCLGYDKKSLLTENDIKAIVDQINHRRNFIALGHSNFLPGAANMKKIFWSQELARFAQRWVNQCEQTLKPEKEDQCRDLENIQVGQSIATVTGPSPGINVKNLVEMWFMQSLDYTGEVTYYNESRDYKSNQFTQLIWATSEKVGCGKAKFYVKNHKITVAERLVCNFAPRGNVHGKPVYIIGYAATQCLDDMHPDIFYPGLCSRPNEVFDNNKSHSGISLSVAPIANSLLRIRNLFNDSEKQEIDPVYHNLKHMTKTCNNECPHSNKKSSSTIVQDNTFDAVKRSHTMNNDNFWINHRNTSRNYVDDFQIQDKGHSRVYHGHDHRNEFDLIHPETLFKDYRRFEYTTTLLNYRIEQDYRKHNVNRQCTRNIGSPIINNFATECNPCKKLKCTRGQKVNPQMSQVCRDREFCTTAPTYPQDFCRCHNFQTTCPTTIRCHQNTNSESFNCNYPVKRCPNMLKTLGATNNNNMEKQEENHYLDLFSNTGLKNYGPTLTTVKHEVKILTNENLKILDKNNFKLFNKPKENNPNYSEIKRSVSEDNTKFKPFWQIDSFANNKQPQLKSIRYTTLANKKNRLSKRTSSKEKIRTETITLKLNHEQNANRKHVSEKYLSFDELMHLRKLNAGNFSSRRFHDIHSEDNEGNQSLRKSESTESTLEYTANTPFIRMKHCTRKLTCTWTAASLTDSAGSIIPGGAGGAAGHMGSRTPPGYVEGCTRTSTCTRDYMNRNKMATLPVETTTPEFDSGDEEDYCERRSLNRRHSNKTVALKTSDLHNKSYSRQNPLNIFTNNERSNNSETFIDCNCCNNNFRNKRNGIINKRLEEKILNYRNKKRENIKFETDYSKNIISYGDLYYSVLKKILNTWKSTNSAHWNSKCLCNNTNKINHYNLLLFISLFIFV